MFRSLALIVSLAVAVVPEGESSLMTSVIIHHNSVHETVHETGKNILSRRYGNSPTDNVDSNIVRIAVVIIIV